MVCSQSKEEEQLALNRAAKLKHDCKQLEAAAERALTLRREMAELSHLQQQMESVTGGPIRSVSHQVSRGREHHWEQVGWGGVSGGGGVGGVSGVSVTVAWEPV